MTILEAIAARAAAAEDRYGPIASTHEAMGVALEEWDELREAIHANKLASVQHEALDLAAVMLRLAVACDGAETSFARRSVK